MEKPGPPIKRSPSEFQSNHHEQIQQFIATTSILSWTPTNDEFFQELNLTAFLGGTVDMIKLHGSSNAEKLQAWGDNQHNFLVWEANICFAARHFLLAGGIKPHVLFTYMNENRGAFSRDVPNRTIQWDHLATHWHKWGCTDQDIWTYLDHPNTRAVFTTQHQTYSHPKVHSVPLGVSPRTKYKIPNAIKHPLTKRTQLLMINDNGWRHRALITQQIKDKFASLRPDLPPLQNTYSNKTNSVQNYVDELRRSKYLLTPSGLGWDCYRIWEALYLGVVPIIELYDRPIDAWRKTLATFPVLWVNHYEDITPDFLESEYVRIAAQSYDYRPLTKQWWIDFFTSFVAQDIMASQKTLDDGNLSRLANPAPPHPHLLKYYKDDRSIPRILHFIYVTPGLSPSQSPLPPEVRNNIDNWNRLHPDWMVIVWDNAAIHEEFPELAELVKPIQTMSWISNLLRYHALEKYGGVYLDVDIVPLQSMEPLRRRFTTFSVCEDPASQGPRNTSAEYVVDYCATINNNVIGVPPHHPALQDIMELSVARTKDRLVQFPDTGGPYKLETTGPPVWSRSAKKFDVTILHASLFYPCNWNQKDKCQIQLWKGQPHVYGMHEWKMSWYKG